MDPRQLWNRNTVLAEAFCLSDEHVKSAQSALDETQAHRSRLLAAFAVTVGSDGSVADLLGLSEREVRVARRTVGKDDARRVAENVLGATPPAAEPEEEPLPEPPPVQQAPAPPVQAAPAQQGYVPQQPHVPQHAAPHTAQQQYLHQPAPQYFDVAQTGPEMPMPTGLENPMARETAWTSAMDVVLIDSWQSGIDLSVLADEFGLDLARLVARVQQLSAEGRLTGQPLPCPAPEDRAGRHRRDSGTTTLGYDPYGGPLPASGWEAPSTIPDEMLAYLPNQHAWPQYTPGAGVR
ncbi:hypothetical protein ABT112_07985 [Streptomyces sp. NPDC002055]|uniref:hypothetical protein n=1 Tax=Streptomyces sp. NPDC002055 TaxID=3154534 RepID=UPI00331B3969